MKLIESNECAASYDECLYTVQQAGKAPQDVPEAIRNGKRTLPKDATSIAYDLKKLEGELEEAINRMPSNPQTICKHCRALAKFCVGCNNTDIKLKPVTVEKPIVADEIV